MERVRGMFSSASEFSLHSLFNRNDLKNEEIKHLHRVYAAMLINVAFTVLGIYIALYVYPINAFIPFIIQIGAFFYLASQNDNGITSQVAFVTFGGSMGAVMAPFVGSLVATYPQVLMTALMGTLSIFVSFSLAATYMKRRTMVFLGGVLSSLVLYLFLGSTANLFFRSKAIDNFIVYAGLFTYMGLVIYDTQLSLDKFRRGDKQYLMHAVALYIDAVSIFLRLARILADKERRRDRERSR